MKLKRYAIAFVSKARRELKSGISSFMHSLRDLPYISVKNKLEMQKKKSHDEFVDYSRYSKLRKALHENKVKMTNEDYGSVRINWDYFGEVLREKNSARKPINKYRYKAIKSTFFPDRNERVNYS